jgi:hypothetical protein
MSVEIEQRRARDFFRRSYETVDPDIVYTREIFKLVALWLNSAVHIMTEQVAVMSPNSIGVRRASGNEEIERKPWEVLYQGKITESGIRVLSSGNIFTKRLVWHP